MKTISKTPHLFNNDTPDVLIANVRENGKVVAYRITLKSQAALDTFDWFNPQAMHSFNVDRKNIEGCIRTMNEQKLWIAAE